MKKTSVITLLGVLLLLLLQVCPVSAIGIFRNTTGNWYLDYNNTGVINKTFHFGTAGDLPVIGDWNNDTNSDIGIFRPSSGYWYFDYNLDGVVDKSFRYGSSTDRIIAGDWQGTGKDGIAIFRPSTGYWYFDYNLDGVVDKSFRYGSSTDRIIAGDWQGTGKDGIAIFRPSSGYWYFDYNLDGTVDKSFRYGSSTDQIIKGNWTGTGTDGIAIFRPSTGYWYFDYNLDGTVDKSFRYGSSTDQIIAGDWNGDGSDGIAIFRPSTGYWYFDYNLDGTVDKSFRYGSSTDRIVAGKWNSVLPATPVAPAAAFTSNKQVGTLPLAVTFTDQSTGTAPLTYAWDFTNDGHTDSTLQNPSFTYTTAGIYTVRLTVTNTAGSDSEIKTSYINVTSIPVAPAAAFTSNKQVGTLPLAVTFTDQSTGTAPLTYAWDFTNDGHTDSTLQNPSFTYTTAGIYTVRLTVTNTAGSDSEIKTSYINVTSIPVAPAAAFTSNKQVGTLPLAVTFTDQSTGTAPLTYAWDLTNDGHTDSTLQNPSFTYTTAGIYTVRLTVTNTAGSDSEIKTSYINVSPAAVAPVAAFTADVRSGYAPLTVRFTNQSTGTAPLSFSWDFNYNGDGDEDSSLSNPTFTYTTPGTYTVLLMVTNSAGSDYDFKSGYITVNEPPAAPVAAFTANRRSGAAPLAVQFADSSTGAAPLTYAWDFTSDGDTDSALQNPSFTYTTAGTYTVGLTVTNSLGTDVETKTGYITVTEDQPGGSHPGVAITFDDAWVEEWYAIRPLLQQYNAHATFFVSQFGSLDQTRINNLKTLKAEGNEIGSHGLYHTDLTEYLTTHSVQEYLDYEIIPGINLMQNAGLEPVDFAYPDGHDDPAVTLALQNYFGHIRDTHYSWDDAVYYEYGSNQAFIAGMGIDDLPYAYPINDVYDAISRAKQEDKILILYGHRPVPTVAGDYQTSYDRLEKILKYVSDNNMKFYTVQELT